MSLSNELGRRLSREQRALLQEMVRRGLKFPPAPTTHNRYRSDPVAFAREVLQFDPWAQQEAILRALAAHRRVTVRSCHNSGKTACAAVATQWFVRSFSPALVLTTAPTARQVEKQLWGEIGSLQRRANLPGRLQTAALEVTPEQRALGLTTNTPERFQGWHCLSEEHEILTRRGWLDIDAINESDEVLSVPVHGETAEWMPVTAVHRYPFEGELNVYSTRNVSFALTDDHRLPVHGQEDKPVARLERVCNLPALSFLRRCSGWEGQPLSVPASFARYGWTAEQFAEFLGFWIGDGGLRMHTKTGRFYEVLLYQVRPDGGYSRGLLPNVQVQTGRDHIVFCDRACAEWLAENVGRYGAERQVPRAVLDAPPAVLNAFCEGFWRAEGTITAGCKRGVYNSNRRLMDQIQEILLKLGRPATLGLNRKAGSAKQADGRAFSMRRDCWRIGWTDRPADHHLLKRNIRREAYSGRVWCISTPHQTFYTRHRGRVFLSGNSLNILVIVDEASGVDETIYEAIEGCLTTANAKLLLIGNPNSPTGTFYESFRSDLYEKFRIEAADVPEHILPAGWREERRMEWGEESPAYQVRVLGEFPEQSEDSLISLKWAEAAQERELPAVGDCIIGVDVARYGDDESGYYARCGSHTIEGAQWRGQDTMKTAGRVAEAARRLGATRMQVDEIGIGAGVVDRLREEGLPVTGINVGEKARDSERFFDRRTEIFWGLRERFRDGDISIPKEDSILLDQLTQLRFSYTPRGQLRLESKDEMRKRRPSSSKWTSPDRADALALTFAAGGNRWIPVVISGEARPA